MNEPGNIDGIWYCKAVPTINHDPRRLPATYLSVIPGQIPCHTRSHDTSVSYPVTYLVIPGHIQDVVHGGWHILGGHIIISDLPVLKAEVSIVLHMATAEGVAAVVCQPHIVAWAQHSTAQRSTGGN